MGSSLSEVRMTGAMQRGVFSPARCLLQVSDGWRRRCCQSCCNITKAQKTEMIEAPTSQWKMNTALPEDETMSQL